MKIPLTVYKASAGSGKTFRLAVDYIKLLVEDPTAYRRILAVTFTNKATEEMKMRILTQLYGISHHCNDGETQDYIDIITQETGHNAEFVRQRAAIALDDSFADAHRILGVCLKAQGKTAESRAALQKAVDLGDTMAKELLNKQ